MPFPRTRPETGCNLEYFFAEMFSLVCNFTVQKEISFIQVVYLTFERLWNFARETFAPVWFLSKVFMLKNLILKSLQKIPFENI